MPPLTRHTVTAAARVMLPIYPLFAAGLGFSFVLTPRPRLLASPALAFADRFIDLHLWGIGFLIVATVLVVALISHHARSYQAALAVMALWIGFYAFTLVVAAFKGGATYSAWTWPAFVFAACVASLMSIETGER